MKRGPSSAAERGRVLVHASADLESAAGGPEDVSSAGSDEQGVMRRVLPAVLVATLGAFSFGYHLGIVNPALEHLARDLGIAANVQIMGAVVSTVLVGATSGSLFAGKLADVFGRKASLSAVAGPLVVGSVMCSFAPNVAMMLLLSLIHI